MKTRAWRHLESVSINIYQFRVPAKWCTQNHSQCSFWRQMSILQITHQRPVSTSTSIDSQPPASECRVYVQNSNCDNRAVRDRQFTQHVMDPSTLLNRLRNVLWINGSVTFISELLEYLRRTVCQCHSMNIYDFNIKLQ